MKDIIIIMFRLIVCIFEIWMLFSFFNIFLKNKLNKKKNTPATIILFALIIFAVNSMDNTILNFTKIDQKYAKNTFFNLLLSKCVKNK